MVEQKLYYMPREIRIGRVDCPVCGNIGYLTIKRSISYLSKWNGSVIHNDNHGSYDYSCYIGFVNGNHIRYGDKVLSVDFDESKIQRNYEERLRKHRILNTKNIPELKFTDDELTELSGVSFYWDSKPRVRFPTEFTGSKQWSES